jgi:prophage antirepressor-like protein
LRCIFHQTTINDKIMEEQDKIIVFQEKQIRRVWHNEQWYFSVLDVIEVLAETKNATDYLKKMRKRDEELKKLHRDKLSPGSCRRYRRKKKNIGSQHTSLVSHHTVYTFAQCRATQIVVS